MKTLKTTTEVLRVTTNVTPITTNPTYLIDLGEVGTNRTYSELGELSSTIPVIAVAAPDGVTITRKNIKHIHIRNNDTVDHNLTVDVFNSPNSFPIWIGCLHPGYTFIYENGCIKIINSQGAVITQGNDKNFVFVQGVPASVWNITHGLNKRPSVTVVDSAGTEVVGKITHLDLNNITIEFFGAGAPVAFSGEAYIN